MGRDPRALKKNKQILVLDFSSPPPLSLSYTLDTLPPLLVMQCHGHISKFSNFAFRPMRLVATAVEFAASAVQIQWGMRLDALEGARRISLLASTLLQT